MTEKQMYEKVVENFAPIGCCRANDKTIWKNQVWRWFYLKGEKWQEINKWVLQGEIIRALPNKVQSSRNVQTVMHYIKIACYSEKFETMGWIADKKS